MIKALGKSQRSRSFDRASKYYWGRQYDHLEPWDTDDEVKLRDKQPAVRVRLTKQVVDTVTAHLFGEGRAPQWKIDAMPGELEDGETENAEGLRDANASLQEVVRASSLDDQLNELGRLAGLNGTVGIAFHLVDGRLDTEVLRLSDATPTFGRDDRARAIERGIDFDDLLELDEYWRSFEVDTVTGEERELWWRRRWELDRTVEFEPIDVSEIDTLDGEALAQLEWVEDDEATVVHELGFVPVEWIKMLEVTNDIDGPPLVDEAEYALEDEVNYTLSQMGRAIRYNGEPKVVFTDVDNINRDAVKVGSQHTWLVQSNPTKNSPAGVEMLELSGEGQRVGFEYVEKLRKVLHEIARVVVHDPEQWAGTLSGTALKLMLAPMVALINDVRPQFEKRLSRLLSKMLRALGEGEFTVSATWPPIVESTPVDLIQIVTSVQQAFEGGLITKRTAVSHLAAHFGIDDVDQYLEQLDQETATAGTVPPGTGLEDLL